MNMLNPDYRLVRRQRRLDRIAAGICTLCGDTPARAGITLCEQCAKDEQENSRRFRAKKRDEKPQKWAMSFEDIGAELGIKANHARTVYCNALKKLRERCAEFGIDASDIIGRGFSSLALAEKWADE